MLQYTGQGDEFSAQVLIFGDGQAKSISIDLSKAPFNLKFIDNPVRVGAFIESVDSPHLELVEQVAKRLNITFVTPPPKTNFDHKAGVVGVPRVRVDIYFVYEVAPIV